MTNLKVGTYGVVRQPFAYTISYTHVYHIHIYIWGSHNKKWDCIHVPRKEKNLPRKGKNKERLNNR